MKPILKTASFVGLALTLLPSFFAFAGIIPLQTSKLLMALGAVLWFGTSVFWIQKGKSSF
jgi:hypothetical protein